MEDLGLAMLEQTNYLPKYSSERRRKILKTQIQNHSFDTIFQELRKLKEKKTGYKQDRIEYDIRWLKKNKHKYYQTILDRENRQQNKITN